MWAESVVTLAQGPSAAEIAQLQREAMQAAREQMQAQREQARAQAEAARVQAQAAQAQGGDGNVSVTRDGEGRTVVRTGDGRTITIDPSAVPGRDAQETIIREALTNVPPVMLHESGPPKGVIPLVGLIMFFLTMIVVGWPLARAWARRIDRRTIEGAGADPNLDARLQRIEHAVDAIAVEVERVSEGQRFATRLLAERADAEGMGAAAGAAPGRANAR